ncbi:MAG: hypothetical protein ACFFD2_02485 [Promethearchaeota archaeon]
MNSVEIGSLLAIISLGTGIFGFFYLAIFMGPPAIICGTIALYIGFKEKEIDSIFKFLAIFGIVLGIAEVVLATFGLLGLINPL